MISLLEVCGTDRLGSDWTSLVRTASAIPRRPPRSATRLSRPAENCYPWSRISHHRSGRTLRRTLDGLARTLPRRPRRSRSAAQALQGPSTPLIEIVTTVGLAIVLYLVITTFVVQTFRVEQQSMLDTLQPQQHLLIDKLTPRFDDYSRGDIIVFHPNGEREQTPFIKRVIAVGGEHVEIHDGAVWIDGVRLDEDDYTYRDPRTGENEPTLATGQVSEWDVPEGSLFVLGDHRPDRPIRVAPASGFVDTDDVVGRAWLRFFPLDTLGILADARLPGARGGRQPLARGYPPPRRRRATSSLQA